VSQAAQAALDARYASVSTALRGRLVQFVGDAFRGLGDYRDADADAFTERILPTVLGAQEQMGALTDSYLSQIVADMFGGAAAPVGVELDQALRGVPPDEVYRRPFVAVWTALAEGVSLAEAVTRGAARLTSITSTDMQLARTNAARQVGADDDRFHFFRRVLRGSFNCALCVLASTQRYNKSSLMPIHPGCDCGIRPIPGTQDPGQIINPHLLEAAHDAVAAGGHEVDRAGNITGRTGKGKLVRGYADVIITHEHGEIGPLLAVRRQNFTGPSDIPPSAAGDTGQ
jgi:hypothetical protein